MERLRGGTWGLVGLRIRLRSFHDYNGSERFRILYDATTGLTISLSLVCRPWRGGMVFSSRLFLAKFRFGLPLLPQVPNRYLMAFNHSGDALGSKASPSSERSLERWASFYGIPPRFSLSLTTLSTLYSKTVTG